MLQGASAAETCGVETIIDPMQLVGPRVAVLLHPGEKNETALADLTPTMFEAALRVPLGRRSAPASR